jgi:hypothetical protein
MRPAAAGVALALALSGCSLGGGGDGNDGNGSPANRDQGARPPSDREQLTALLNRRARALQEGDVRGYVATAKGPQRTRDRRAARNARNLPLRAVRLTAADITVDGRSAVLQVRSGYAIAGIRGRFDAERTLRAVRTERGWRIYRQTGRRRQHPWEVARFTAERTSHFVVLAPTGLATDGIADALEGGYTRMRDILASGRLRRRYLVVVAADARQARAMTSGIRGVATLAAISDTGVRESGPAEEVVRVASQRLFVVWPRFGPLDPDGRGRVVAHELTHAALAGETSGRTPSWLVEGIALYVSGDRRVADAAQLVGDQALSGSGSGGAGRALTLTGLSRPDAIARLDGAGQAAAYAYSSAAAFYITARYGRERFFDLYDVFNEASLQGEPGPDLADRALRRTLGIGLMKLERDLRRWIVTRAVVDPFAP